MNDAKQKNSYGCSFSNSLVFTYTINTVVAWRVLRTLYLPVWIHHFRNKSFTSCQQMGRTSPSQGFLLFFFFTPQLSKCAWIDLLCLHTAEPRVKVVMKFYFNSSNIYFNSNSFLPNDLILSSRGSSKTKTWLELSLNQTHWLRLIGPVISYGC